MTAALLAWEETVSDYDARQKIVDLAEEYQALPGDVIVSSDGSRAVVRHAEVVSEPKRHSCGCCSTNEYRYEVWVDSLWDGPVEVITKGGGTTHVMPVERWAGSWPPEDAIVMRDGESAYGPSEDQHGVGSDPEDPRTLPSQSD